MQAQEQLSARTMKLENVLKQVAPDYDLSAIDSMVLPGTDLAYMSQQIPGNWPQSASTINTPESRHTSASIKYEQSESEPPEDDEMPNTSNEGQYMGRGSGIAQMTSLKNTASTCKYCVYLVCD